MKPIRVALPLGIGDAHWSAQKIQGIKDRHGGAPIHAFINESTNHKTVGYLRMLPFIDHAEMSKDAPYCITNDMPGTYRDDRYQHLDGCRAWRGFDYVLVANHWVESGRHISAWLPGVPTQYDFSLRYDQHTLDRTVQLMPEPTVLLYPSGIGPNHGFHNGWWKPNGWLDVVRMLNRNGITPLFVGADTSDDRGYWKIVQKLLGKLSFRSVVGETTIPDYMKLIERCRCWIGLNSGGGIVSASLRTPTVMMWGDRRWPVGNPNVRFNPDMHRSWLSPEQLTTYRTLSYGDPETTPANVVAAALEVVR